MRYGKFFAAILLLVFCLAVSGTSMASVEVKMSYNGPADVDNNAVHLYAVNFKKLVEEGTGGEVTIRLFPDSQLGNEEERMELLTKQGMNQPVINVASFAGVAPVFPEIYASAVPFMFDSYEAAHLFFDESRYWNRPGRSSISVQEPTCLRPSKRADSLLSQTTRRRSGPLTISRGSGSAGWTRDR